MLNTMRNILIILLLSICSITFGQNDNLSGNIYILSCFVSDGIDTWTPDEKTKMLSKANEALVWISNEGNKYGKKVVFEHGCFGTNLDIVIDNIERGRSTGKEDISIMIYPSYKVCAGYISLRMATGIALTTQQESGTSYFHIKKIVIQRPTMTLKDEKA